jgi:hypothetical protein
MAFCRYAAKSAVLVSEHQETELIPQQYQDAFDRPSRCIRYEEPFFSEPTTAL